MKEQIEAVQRMQDYIHAHFAEEITMDDLASVACFSPWHARRVFLRLTGLTPTDYIRRLRLRQSALMLRDERARILDAALESGFGSVDGYQRAFFRAFGCNPGQYARHPRPLPLFTPYGVRSAHAERKKTDMSEAKCIFIETVEKPARKVVIKRGVKAAEYFEYCGEVGCDVWGILTSIKSISGEPVCLWLPDRYVLPGTSVYVQGAEVPTDYAGEIPEGFDVIELPAARYLKFQGEPFRDEDYEDAIQTVWRAEKRYDPRNIGLVWDADNPRIQLEPIGERGYIELVPVK